MKSFSISASLLLVFVFRFGLEGNMRQEFKTTYPIVVQENTVKSDAFSVLRNKCNICHATKKRVDIFTFENMDSMAVAIEEQVFIKEKMPKGRKTVLDEIEKIKLKKWLAEVVTE